MKNKTRVLILDDDDDDIFLVRELIKEIDQSSYVVESTNSPAEAAKSLSGAKADIVLCDYRMGHITGIDFIKEQRERGDDTPIILLTGLNDRSTDEAALNAGASDFISKINLRADTLDRSIRYALASTQRQRVFQSVLDNVNAGVVMLDENLVPSVWNPEFELIVEYATGKRSDESTNAFLKMMLTEKQKLNVKNRVYEKKISYTADKAMVLLLHDVTPHIEALREREAAKNKAAHLAMNCSLTGLPNRNSFVERIEAEIKNAERHGYEFFMLILDLNKFKEVNDVYGHHTGDVLLKEVTSRFKKACREGDFLARLGGDEFVAIQRCHPNAKDQIPELANRLIECLGRDMQIDGIELQIGLSIGVARYPDHGRNAEELLSNADTAMYRAKGQTSGQIQVFNEEMDRKIREARMLGQELRVAVDSGDIDVHFQIQADVETGTVKGHEALARWTHPKLGIISPTTFIPIAEERGLITRLGQVVLENACNIAAHWPKHLTVSVNVSPVQIRDSNLIEIVHQALRASGLPAERLELEVTESVLIDDKIRALYVLRGLKNLGVSIALDDFGTGFSSLSTLIAFPFDKIKIDRSFIEECNRNEQAALVTRTIINMGTQMGCEIIAEGVQTEEHITFLRKEGCQSMQGFLIGKPCSNEELQIRMLREISGKCAVLSRRLTA
ncbi:MAG: GGDEF/EAL domain-containing response regulator [Anderseniella sp.]